MGYIKAEYGKNNMFEEILNSIAKGKAKTFIGYKRALIGAIECAEFNNHE